MKSRSEIAAAIEAAEVEATNKQWKASKTVRSIIIFLLVLAVVITAFSTYVSFVKASGNGVPHIFGLQMLSIQTDSMYPILKPGDLIFDTVVNDPKELKVDDIITYWTVINGERVLNTHKIHSIYVDADGEHLVFATKGEANMEEDPLTVHESEIVGKYRFRVGGLGKVFDYLQTSTGFLGMVVIAVLVFFIIRFAFKRR